MKIFLHFKSRVKNYILVQIKYSEIWFWGAKSKPSSSRGLTLEVSEWRNKSSRIYWCIRKSSKWRERHKLFNTVPTGITINRGSRTEPWGTPNISSGGSNILLAKQFAVRLGPDQVWSGEAQTTMNASFLCLEWVEQKMFYFYHKHFF